MNAKNDVSNVAENETWQAWKTGLKITSYALISFSIWFLLWVWLELITASKMSSFFLYEWLNAISDVVFFNKPETSHPAATGFALLLVVFVVLESFGVYRNVKTGSGHTFSEFMWNFLKAGPARSIAGISVALALATRAATLPFLFEGNPSVFVHDLPWIALCTGLGLWLTQHFLFLGKRG